MPVERRGLSSRAAQEGGQDMGTGESLSAPQSVQRLQSALHAKAKESPDAELLKSVVRRVSDGRMLHRVKAWLEMAVELLLAGSGQSGLRGGGPTHDPAAASMAVPQAQGEDREVRAILGREAVGSPQARSPRSANGQLSVGEGMISSESPMREIRTLGSPSGDWKRSHGVD